MFKPIFLMFICFLFIKPINVFSQYPASVISTEEFISIVGANLLRHRGSEFTVRGAVVSATLGTRYSFTISLQSTGFRTVDFRFSLSTDMLDSVSNIEPNDIVTISGVVRDAYTLTDAKIISIEKINQPFQLRALYTEEEIRELIMNRILLINGKTLRFTGIVRHIGEGFGGYFLRFGSEWGVHRAVFNRQYREQILSINTGDTVTVEGTFMIWGGPQPFTQVGFFNSTIIE